MNEQTTSTPHSHRADAVQPEARLHDMIVRLMTVAQLLAAESSAQDTPSPVKASRPDKKHKRKNL